MNLNRNATPRRGSETGALDFWRNNPDNCTNELYDFSKPPCPPFSLWATDYFVPLKVYSSPYVVGDEEVSLGLIPDDCVSTLCSVSQYAPNEAFTFESGEAGIGFELGSDDPYLERIIFKLEKDTPMLTLLVER